MIEVGDLVRVKNSQLKAANGNVFVLFNRRRYKKRPWKTFRGKQIIARVLQVNRTYDWRTRRTHTLVMLDVPTISIHSRERNWVLDGSYLVVHRKAKTNGAVTAT